MLYRIVESDDLFERCINSIRKAYWPFDPKEMSQRNELKNRIDQAISSAINDAEARDHNKNGNYNEDEIVYEAIQKTILKFFEEEEDSNEMYTVYSVEGEELSHFPIPFMSRFHSYFYKRRWITPPQNRTYSIEDLFRLDKLPDSKDSGVGNYSAKAGDYKHFVNVVAALARLIRFFHHNNNAVVFGNRIDVNALLYKNVPNQRTFALMLAGFFHDIGKTIVDSRHAMEGATILEHHTTRSPALLHNIVKQYSKDFSFDRDTLTMVADFVLFHDQYGTMSTGEDGYLQLVAIIDRFKRYSLIEGASIVARKDWIKQAIFDLWLLNVADIMVSIGHPKKFGGHGYWGKYEDQLGSPELPSFGSPKKSNEIIQEFFKNSSKSEALLHDLKLSMEFVERHCAFNHMDDLKQLYEFAHETSRRHVVERLRRLIRSALRKPLFEKSKKENDRITSIKNELSKLNEQSWNSIIVRCIKATSDFNEFCERFSWIGKMDYALGFFQHLAKAALARTSEELDGGPKTGWLRSMDEAKELDDEFLAKTQAKYFADNYASTVVQILNYLVFREPRFDRARNIEFSDAARRIKEQSDKINQIIALEGPYRARRASQSILQTIYLY
jgi:hypothetical protein